MNISEKKIPEEYILARSQDYPNLKVDSVEYPSATYPPLARYKLGPDDYRWIKLEDEYVYAPQAYALNRGRSWFNPLFNACEHLSRFLPGQILPEVEGKFVSSAGKPIPYRVCIGTNQKKTNRLPLVDVEKVVFKPGSVATVVLNPEPCLLFAPRRVMSNIIQIVAASGKAVRLSFSYEESQHYVINGENDPNLVPLGGDLTCLKYYDWNPEQITELDQHDRVYISVEDKHLMDLLNETVTWVRSEPSSTNLLKILQNVLEEGVAMKVIPWLRQFSPLDSSLIAFTPFWSTKPTLWLRFPTVYLLQVEVPFSSLPHLMLQSSTTGKHIAICYKDPAITSDPEFLLEQLLLKPEDKIIDEKGRAWHLISTLNWLCKQRAPLELALNAWLELLQFLDPEQNEHLQMQNISVFANVWNKLTQEAPT